MKKPNRAQLETLVNICINLGSISFASFAVPVVFDKGGNLVLLFGLEVALTFWFFALNISGKIEK